MNNRARFRRLPLGTLIFWPGGPPVPLSPISYPTCTGIDATLFVRVVLAFVREPLILMHLIPSANAGVPFGPAHGRLSPSKQQDHRCRDVPSRRTSSAVTPRSYRGPPQLRDRRAPILPYRTNYKWVSPTDCRRNATAIFGRYGISLRLSNGTEYLYWVQGTMASRARTTVIDHSRFFW